MSDGQRECCLHGKVVTERDVALVRSLTEHRGWPILVSILEDWKQYRDDAIHGYKGDDPHALAYDQGIYDNVRDLLETRSRADAVMNEIAEIEKREAAEKKAADEAGTRL